MKPSVIKIAMPKEFIDLKIPFEFIVNGKGLGIGEATPTKLLTDLINGWEREYILSKKLGRAQGYGLVMTLFAAQMTYKYFEKKGEVEKCQKALAENLWEDEFEDDPMDI